MKSQLPRTYQRRTLATDALIDRGYLAVTNLSGTATVRYGRFRRESVLSRSSG